MDQTVRYEVQGAIATITLDRLQAQLRKQLIAVGQPKAIANLEQPWIALLLRDVAGIDHQVAQRISALDAKISLHNDCRCAIVVVPGDPATRS